MDMDRLGQESEGQDGSFYAPGLTLFRGSPRNTEDQNPIDITFLLEPGRGHVGESTATQGLNEIDQELSMVPFAGGLAGNSDAEKDITQALTRGESLSRKKPKFTCPICLEALENASSTKCGHVFCEKCIFEALSRRNKCPICRKRTTKTGVRHIYLPKVE